MTRNYFTVQMSANAVGGEHCIHLGSRTATDGLGDNICKNSRHGWDAKGNKYGFSCGGGWSDPDAFPCGGCLFVLRNNPGPVTGMFAELFAPPKPDEPQGLGAVVIATCQCGDGRTFVREPLTGDFDRPRGAAGLPWKSTCGHHQWSDLTDVEVKSEGWSA